MTIQAINLSRDILRFRSLIAGDLLLLQLAEAAPLGPHRDTLLLRIKSDLAFRRTQLALVQHFATGQKAGFRPDQPRLPAGSSAGGQWTTGDVGDAETKPEPVFLDPRRYAVQKTIEAGLALYTWLSTRNGPDAHATVAFKAKQFGSNEQGQINLDNVAVLDRDQVESTCPRLDEVQERTNRAAEEVAQDRDFLLPKQYGTAVHKNLKDQIDALDDRNFRAEVSYLKGDEEGYGARGSIRIDVLENAGRGTVCVYDIKTGRSGLSVPRMTEIAAHVFGAFPGTQRIIVSEIRPRR